jgi:hypothetical protein
MKIVRLILSSMAAVLVVGAIASAAPHLAAHGPVSLTEGAGAPTETPEPTDTPEPTEAPDPTDTPDPTETPDPTGGTGAGVAPDFSACAGLTGLENAICRHEALLAVHPDNKGLQNALAHLQANLTNHQAGAHGHSADSHGQSGLPHGHSGDPHGNSGS